MAALCARLVLFAALLALLHGCQNPRAESRLAQRRESLQWTLDRLSGREQEAPQRLQRDLAWIRDDIARHNQMFERDLRQLQADFEFDVRRWNQQQEAYRQKIWDILRGKPQQIPDALLLFL